MPPVHPLIEKWPSNKATVMALRLYRLITGDQGAVAGETIDAIAREIEASLAPVGEALREKDAEIERLREQNDGLYAATQLAGNFQREQNAELARLREELAEVKRELDETLNKLDTFKVECEVCRSLPGNGGGKVWHLPPVCSPLSSPSALAATPSGHNERNTNHAS